MKTEWDYTELADAYLKRPDYSPEALQKLFDLLCLSTKAKVCDVGAGVAHLTLVLAGRGFEVTAVEPNDAMRENGRKRTAKFSNVTWFEGTGEATGQSDKSFDLVTFGSSFNVVDQAVALKETKRILKPKGWFACMWNHRDLDDPLQKEIEAIISRHVPGYSYGKRREDQSEVIKASGLFLEATKLEGRVEHLQSRADCVEAWRSHSTLHRQAGDKFKTVVAGIENLLAKDPGDIKVPYVTRIWAAQVR